MNFLKRLSIDQSDENVDGGKGGGFNPGSLLSGTTKLFDSVNEKKTGLVTGISSKFDQLKKRTSMESFTMTDKEAASQETGVSVNTTAPTTDANPSRAMNPDQMKHGDGNYGTLNSQASLSHDSASGVGVNSGMSATKRSTNPFMEDLNSNSNAASSKPAKSKPPKPPPPRQNTNPFLNYTGSNPANPPADNSTFGYVAPGANSSQTNQTSLAQECEKIASEMGHMTKGPNKAHDLSDDDSSASEYGDSGAQPLYTDETDALKKSNSNDSLASLDDENPVKCGEMMKTFVFKTLNKHQSISIDEISTFGTYCKTHTGRVLYARTLEKKSENSLNLSQEVIFTLMQHFTVALHECMEYEDFMPAKRLMILAFKIKLTKNITDTHNNEICLGSYLKNHGIWQSLRYWNAAFFASLHEEKLNASRMGNVDINNVNFNNTRVYLDYMQFFGLSKETRQEFVRKQSQTLDLTEDQMRKLRASCN